MTTRLPFTALTATLLTGCGAHTNPDTGDTFFSCFTKGANVATPEGLTPIEELEVGDLVWSWDTDTNEPIARRVRECIVGEAQTIHHIQAGEHRIDGVTGEHPFWVPTASAWLKAESLQRGQQLLCWLGQHESKALSIAHTQTKHLDAPVPVFTLSIEGAEQNFFVNGILVHNKSPMPICWQVEQDTTTVDFGDTAVQTTIERIYTLRIRNIDNCSWLEEPERTLTVTLDDPSGAFTLTAGPIDLAALQQEQVDFPLSFTPDAAGDYEAQILFSLPEFSMAMEVPPKTVQIFGTGAASEP